MNNSTTKTIDTGKVENKIYKIFKSLNIPALLIFYILILFIVSPAIVLLYILNYIFYDFFASFTNVQQFLFLMIYFLTSHSLLFALALFKFKKHLKNLYYNMYFNFVIKFGKAISNEDFNKIKKDDAELYDIIKKTKCISYCFAVGFDLLKVLKKGRIRFIAYKVEDERNYLMHVLYINNNWCFDTDTCKQYSLKHYNKSRKNVIYKDFSYDDIKDLSFYDFKNKIDPKLETFAKSLNMPRVWKDESNFFYD